MDPIKKRVRARYEARMGTEVTYTYKLELKSRADEDILDQLDDHQDAQAYLKRLIRADIGRGRQPYSFETKYCIPRPQFLPVWGLTSSDVLRESDVEYIAEDIGRPAAELRAETEEVPSFWSWVLIDETTDGTRAELFTADDVAGAYRYLEDSVEAIPLGERWLHVNLWAIYAPVVAGPIEGLHTVTREGVTYSIDVDYNDLTYIERIVNGCEH